MSTAGLTQRASQQRMLPSPTCISVASGWTAATMCCRPSLFPPLCHRWRHRSPQRRRRNRSHQQGHHKCNHHRPHSCHRQLPPQPTAPDPRRRLPLPPPALATRHRRRPPHRGRANRRPPSCSMPACVCSGTRAGRTARSSTGGRSFPRSRGSGARARRMRRRRVCACSTTTARSHGSRSMAHGASSCSAVGLGRRAGVLHGAPDPLRRGLLPLRHRDGPLNARRAPIGRVAKPPDPP